MASRSSGDQIRNISWFFNLKNIYRTVLLQLIHNESRMIYFLNMSVMTVDYIWHFITHEVHRIFIQWVKFLNPWFTAGQWSCRKVMFRCSDVSVNQYVHGSNVMINPCTQALSQNPQLPNAAPHCTGNPTRPETPVREIWWQWLESCSNLFTSGSSWHWCVVCILLEYSLIVFLQDSDWSFSLTTF